ncbi:MAG TPA: RasGEF domain-containing protein [Parachlamydiaceae bacterium]|nr:RasGEF domain-containing protein [Parachlamydiaceae bacterium]
MNHVNSHRDHNVLRFGASHNSESNLGEIKEEKKMNSFLNVPENIKSALYVEDSQHPPKKTLKLKASSAQHENSYFSSVNALSILSNSGFIFPEDLHSEDDMDFINYSSMQSHPESLYLQNIHSQMNESVLSEFVDAISCGKDKYWAYEMLAGLLEDEKKKSILLHSLNGKYKFLMDLASIREMFELSNILEAIAGSAEKKILPNYNKLINADTQKSLIDISKDKPNEIIINPKAFSKRKIDSFENFAKNFMVLAKKDKKWSRGLALVYPFFTENKCFFKELSKLETTEKKIVFQILRAMVGVGFPKDIGQLDAVKTELQILDEKFNIHKFYIQMLENAKLQGYAKDVGEQIGTIESSENMDEIYFHWKDWTPSQIAKALTERDFTLIGQLDLFEIKNFLYSGDLSTSQDDLQICFDSTVNWLAFQIVSEVNTKHRLDAINKLIDAGTTLLNIRNFHTASQIALALKLPAVNRFLNKSQITGPKYVNLIKFSDLEKIHNQYFFKSEYKYNLLLPITNFFWNQFWLECKLVDTYSAILSYENFKEIEKFAEHLFTFRRAHSEGGGNSEIKKLVSLLSSIDHPLNEEINEWSDFSYAVQNKLPLVYLKKPLSEWKVGNFLPFLEDNSKQLRVNNMFANMISNGQTFIKVFSQNKKIIGDWPEKLKETMWLKYLEHLLKPVEYDFVKYIDQKY